MKLIAGIFLFFFVHALSFGQACQPGTFAVNCGGVAYCVPKGSQCCGRSACGPTQFCMACAAQTYCAPKGSQCCGTRDCGPGTHCAACPGGITCLRSNESCAGGAAASFRLDRARDFDLERFFKENTADMSSGTEACGAGASPTPSAPNAAP
jgi:hypothetical protein